MAFNVALIGAGKWSENHLAGWRGQPDVDITWVVRSTADSARLRAQQWGVPNWSADYKEVIRREDIHIVDILLPHDLHAEAACAALAHGKHVVLEKPLAPTLAGARQIAEAARTHKRKVMISENWVYSTWVQKAHGILANGDIGTPFLVRSSMDMDVRPYFEGLGWRSKAGRMGGGALMDAGIHAISASRYLLGEIRDVTASIHNFGFRSIAPMEDTSLVLFGFESGAMGVFTVAWLAQRERPRTEFVILGTKGTIESDTHGRQFFLTREGSRCEQFNLQASRGFVEQMTHFLQCVREDREPITSPEEQIGSLKAVLAAYSSVELGRPVRVADLTG
jgi:predicted dehydrogenase